MVDPLILEGFACRDALQLIVFRVFKRVIFEGNCLILIKALQGGNTPLGIQNLVQDIHVLSRHLDFFSSVRVGWSCNKVAHKLAQLTLHDVSFAINPLYQQEVVLGRMPIPFFQ